ncbi:L-glutamate gamma-semialdehyde dehydrogenase [Fischerella thermalis]|uniref:L-glutamate gamma-semialdehyde dehydrogenase n=1 Tax=Fischerella thermalis JSC-11 TaxID=741277 RepID=G6FYX4_9CYAN|nr:L-glutamate gamma-semialdehyde dehydrogenase [Fischerella thermalis]PMB07978.1 L-glutamate gamma-semialdehyde dehydrogenase [Fischerella thermalis CCMEE 5328]EHC09436.1 delta-1-pyrroline-5-carboxylate dehydrogenase [Fischerella thermalis JSC-11]PLZ07807.1 L-glutamate gamma-semialdehyde dehydrogenase [Fischerella thermalis WC119]PLZ12558.1 L-glutamate gamma-semialdehyde dehydrogenase [Fischerella thermalis WC1110]PLZ13772.1 L-glutamate gamma-semialdehyde dehydrogenase [Fischerella thermalis 
MVLQVKTSAYEAKTQEIAKILLGVTQENRNFFSALRDQMRWDDRILAWAMSNPGLRVQLFRFIDTLPALHSKSEIAAHLQEYLGDETVELPSALKGMLNFANPDSMPGQVAATTVATAVETLAHRYIAGENIKQVLKTIERLRKDKMAFTVDLLGEAVITEAEAQSYLERYLDLMQQLAEAAKNWATVPLIDQADGEPLPKVQVSVKLTAFYSQFDSLDPQGSEARVSDRIRILLRRAKELGVAVHFDMEQYEYKDLIFNILKKLLLEEEFRARTDIGMTIQAYLRDSEQDAKALIDWAKERGYPMTIRLVKGAYWDQETIKAEQKHWPQPVYNDKAATDANFENITQLLLENHQYVYAAIGSHNVRSQAHAIAIAQSLKVPSRCFEMQVLYGMGDKLAKALVDQGYRVRVYCPYGELLPGMAYLIRRLLENTANSSFLRQNLENRPVEELLAPPTFKQEDKEKVARGDGRRELVATDTDDKVARGEGRREFRTLEENGKTAVKFVGAADTDYAEEESRKESQQALQTVRQQLGKTYLPLINGEYVNTQEMINSVNPSNYTEVVGKIGLSSVEQAEQAMQAAKAAFPSWRKTPVQQRAGILYKAADLMEQRRAELAAWIVLEVGKTVREADAEVSEAIDFCRYYAMEMERLEQGYNYDVAGETNRYIYQPRGIAVVISPWNFPLAIATGMTVAALVAGNCTLLKPAETSSVIAAKLTEVLVDAGIPKGVFQYVPGKGSQVGAYLVNHIDTHVIAFTGSQEVGCRIYAEAANLKPGQKHMKRVIAEMGGKNAIIVDESADLDQAVMGVVQSAFGYSGQKCSACSRVIVHTAIYDSFVRRFTEATKSLNIGAAELPGTKVGPVIDANARDRIREYIEKGKAEAKVALEMPAPENGYFIGPVIFTDVSPNAVIAQQEIFGPVVAVIKANNFQEALSIANSTNYALTGGLYSRTPSHIQKAQEDFEVGNLYINRTITGAIVARQPFGGFKLSGVGSKAGGPDYLLQFLEPRTITENIQRQGFAPIEGAE